MDKSQFVSYISRYYLGGLVESVVWSVKDSICTIDFYSPSTSTAGKLIFPFIHLSDDVDEFGVIDTTSLLKFLSPMNDELKIIPEKEYDIWMRLNISDNKFEGYYSLADIRRGIKKGPEVREPKVFDVSFPIDKEFKTQFEKSYNALGKINRFTIEAGEKIKITVGDKNSYSNKLSFSRITSDYLPLRKIAFSADALFNILKNNHEDGFLEISDNGMMKISFEFENGSVKYYLIQLEEV